MKFILPNNDAVLHSLSDRHHFNLFQNNTKQEILSLHPTISCRRYPLTLTSVFVPRKVSVWQQWTTDLSNGWNYLKYIWTLCHFQVTIHIRGIQITEEWHTNSKTYFPFAILLIPKVSVILSFLLCTIHWSIAICYRCIMNIATAAIL